MRRTNKQLSTEYENWGTDWSPDHRVFVTGGQGFRVENETGKTFCIGEVDKAGKPLPLRHDIVEGVTGNSGLTKRRDNAEKGLNIPPTYFVTDNQGCCKACGDNLPPGVRRDKQYCSAACRQRTSRTKRKSLEGIPAYQ